MFDLFLSLFFLVVGTILLTLFNLGKYHKIKKGKKKKNITFVELRYLEYKYNINYDKMLNRRFIMFISFINILIISSTYYISSLFKMEFVFQLMVCLILVVGLIYSVYGIIGLALEKGGLCNEHKTNRK